MALVDKDHLTELRSAAEARTTALTGLDEIQLKAVAYAINTASNTGETSVIFKEALRENTVAELKAKGYKILDAGYANKTSVHLISWKE